MSTVTFQYVYKDKRNDIVNISAKKFEMSVEERNLAKEALRKLKGVFKSAEVSFEPEYDKRVFIIEYNHSNLRTLNEIIGKEVINSMDNKGEYIGGKHLPKFKLSNGYTLTSKVDYEFLRFKDVPFDTGYFTPRAWEDWLLFIELKLVAKDLENDIKQMTAETYGDKILVLFNSEGGERQALSLLEQVQDDLTKAELTTLLNAMHGKMYGLQRTIG